MKSRFLCMLALALLCGQTALAAGDPAAGARKATTCLGCHGVSGYRNAYPSYHVPKLGGQHAEYIVSALKEYKTGKRAHSTMHAQAASLSEEDMQDIAAYFTQSGTDEQ